MTKDLLMFLSALTDYHRRFTTLGGALVASGGPRFYKYRRLMLRYLDQRDQRQRLYDAWYNLIKRGYLQRRIFGKSEAYVLSPKGELKIFHERVRLSRSRSKLPNGQWLMVFFDIPETKRKMRDSLRAGLENLGFSSVQKSVWATRRQVKDEMRQLLDLLGAKKYVKLLLVREL